MRLVVAFPSWCLAARRLCSAVRCWAVPRRGCAARHHTTTVHRDLAAFHPVLYRMSQAAGTSENKSNSGVCYGFSCSCFSSNWLYCGALEECWSCLVSLAVMLAHLLLRVCVLRSRAGALFWLTPDGFAGAHGLGEMPSSTFPEGKAMVLPWELLPARG